MPGVGGLLMMPVYEPGDPDEPQPLTWLLELLGYSGFRMRVWYEPIEDEL